MINHDGPRRCRIALDSPARIRRRAIGLVRDGLIGARPAAEVAALVQALATLGAMLETRPAELAKGER
jgi:hypothetical protein